MWQLKRKQASPAGAPAPRAEESCPTQPCPTCRNPMPIVGFDQRCPRCQARVPATSGCPGACSGCEMGTSR